MLNRSVPIGVMLAAALSFGCGRDPVVPVGTKSAEPDTPVFPSASSPTVTAPLCVPFKAKGNPGSVQIAGGPPPAPLDVTISADGQATELGHYTSSASAVVSFTSPTTAVFDGGGTFVAANGDQLVFTYTGDFFPGPVAGGRGPYEFTGGTGRFDGATGHGLFNSEGGGTTFDGEICLAR